MQMLREILKAKQQNLRPAPTSRYSNLIGLVLRALVFVKSSSGKFTL